MTQQKAARLSRAAPFCGIYTHFKPLIPKSFFFGTRLTLFNPFCDVLSVKERPLKKFCFPFNGSSFSPFIRSKPQICALFRNKCFYFPYAPEFRPKAHCFRSMQI